MRIIIVYDNETCNENLASGWGFSCHIKSKKTNLLFDTGWDSNVLFSNMSGLGIELKGIELLFLSHSHWDHTGALAEILHMNPALKVYLPASFSRRLKDEIKMRSQLTQISGPVTINNECITTGESGKGVKEQSLIVRSKKGLIVITGCAHQGIEAILSTARRFGKVYGLIGGFHHFEEYDLLENIELIAPCHCTYNKKVIRKLFPEKYVKCCAGKVIEVD